MASINQLINESGLGGPAKRALRELFLAVLSDSGAGKADMGLLGAKLDADVGVTDTNYAALLVSPSSSGGLTK